MHCLNLQWLSARNVTLKTKNLLMQNVKKQKLCEMASETLVPRRCQKSPKNRISSDSNEKMRDMVINTMTSVTEKLAAMNKRLTGLASHIHLQSLLESLVQGIKQKDEMWVILRRHCFVCQ